MSVKKQIKNLLPTAVFEAIEPTGHKLETMSAALRLGSPAKKLRVIGVTGTNGKTSTSFFIFNMMKYAGMRVGLLTTVACGVGEAVVPQKAHVTTASGPRLHRQLKEMYAQGAEWVVLETTSHSLAQHRVWGVPYEIAVLTNVTHEHLDYHKTFERYTEAKRQLFVMASKHARGYAVVNADEPQCDMFRSTVREGATYGIGRGDVRAHDVVTRTDGSTYTAHVGDDEYHISVQLPGMFNVSNSLAALAVGRRLGLRVEQIERGIAATKNITGRMNILDMGQDYTVIIDFAHTPDAFERLLSDVKKTTKGRMIVLFGSAGKRDVSKRALQGKVAGSYADVIVLTEEDDRDEDGMGILNEIEAGVRESSRQVSVEKIIDRTQAIAHALSIARAEDTVLFLGKGHERTIERADGEYPWDEAAIVRECYEAMAHAS